ncbi:hypothetical protein Trydic_g17075 [Trypoxylus dichotomus]
MKQKLKNRSNDRFKMKDLGEANNILGFRITRDRREGKLWIEQEKYIDALLQRFNMTDCKPCSTPLDPNQKLSSEMSPKDDSEREEMEKIPYQSAVGSLLYVAQSTRPDITFAVSLLSRFNNNPGKAHWTAVKRVLRYLKSTKNMKIQYTKEEEQDLHGYCDADWGSDLDNRRSVSGYVFISQGPIA